VRWPSFRIGLLWRLDSRMLRPMVGCRVSRALIFMIAKNKTEVRWIAGAWLIFWILGLFGMHGRVWIAVWFSLAVIYLGAFWLLSRGSDIDTEAGLQRVSSVMVGLIFVQVAFMFFMAFQAASTK
jgi:hypothetical protein